MKPDLHFQSLNLSDFKDLACEEQGLGTSTPRNRLPGSSASTSASVNAGDVVVGAPRDEEDMAPTTPTKFEA